MAIDNNNLFFSIAQQPLIGQGLLIIEASRSHSGRHTTLGRAPLDEWSAWCRDFYLTTHNTHKRQTSTPPAGFKTTIPTNERLQTHALNCTATGISDNNNCENTFPHVDFSSEFVCDKKYESSLMLNHVTAQMV
jgi:hypothetical protein